ncbi:MAG TPA: hypothetical protein DEB10_13670, partial [Ruminococcaceae bacterium]|nr:hypothetical protein [Oscillospiraceae bacterium]
ALISSAAGLFRPWLLLLSLASGLLTVIAALWYPHRYADELHGSFDGKAVRATTGVFTKKRIFVPVNALRTYELCSTPLQRLFGCRTMILRFAGGAAYLHHLPKDQAEMLTAALEQCEKH